MILFVLFFLVNYVFIEFSPKTIDYFYYMFEFSVEFN